jgi:hypothetical protein
LSALRLTRDLAAGLIELGFGLVSQLKLVLEILVNPFADRLNLGAGQFWNGCSNFLNRAHGSSLTGGRQMGKVQIEWLTAFGCRLFYEGFQFGARLRIVKQLFPTLIVDSRELAQLVEYRASFGVTKLWQLFDDLRCAHGADYNLVSAICQPGGQKKRGQRSVATATSSVGEEVSGRRQNLFCDQGADALFFSL